MIADCRCTIADWRFGGGTDLKSAINRASSTVLDRLAMTDTFERLKAALAARYTIERELGAGGMATVYLAEDLKLHRKVALKVLRPELAAALGPERFLREIEIAAKLHHPHILALHDSGEADGFLYYVMPYVDGESLRDRLNREKQLPVEDALQNEVACRTTRGTSERRGVVHRCPISNTSCTASPTRTMAV